MSLSPQKQKAFALTLLLVVAGLFAFGYLVVKGMADKRDRDTAEVEQLQGKVAEKVKAIETEKQNRERAKTYQSFIANYEEQMPKGNVETWLVKQISELAIVHRVQIANTALQNIPEISDFRFHNQPYHMQGFQFDFHGEFLQIGQFLNDLENKMPLVEVENLTITAGAGGEKYLHGVQVTISMVVKS